MKKIKTHHITLAFSHMQVGFDARHTNRTSLFPMAHECMYCVVVVVMAASTDSKNSNELNMK